MKKGLLLFKIVGTLLVSVLCILLAHVINPFSFISIVPKDKVYDVCIAVYFSIGSFITEGLIDLINKCIESKKVYIEAVFSHKNEVSGLQSKPCITFNSCDMAEIELEVSIHGNSKQISDLRLEIPKIAQSDFQVGRKTIGAEVNNNGDFVIHLSKICGNSGDINIRETFLITMQRIPIDDKATITMKPELSLEKKSLWIDYTSNSAIVRLEDK